MALALSRNSAICFSSSVGDGVVRVATGTPTSRKNLSFPAGEQMQIIWTVLEGRVVELMWGIGRNIDCVACTHGGSLTPEGHFHLALKKDEGLFEVVTMRTGTAAGWYVHVDHTEAVVGVFASDGDGIRVSDETDMLSCRTIRPGESQAAAEIVGRKWSELGCSVRHMIYPFAVGLASEFCPEER
jgi:hypothetical protein